MPIHGYDTIRCREIMVPYIDIVSTVRPGYSSPAGARFSTLQVNHASTNAIKPSYSTVKVRHMHAWLNNDHTQYIAGKVIVFCEQNEEIDVQPHLLLAVP